MSIGNKATPIMKGELVRPEMDPSVLKTLPNLDSVKIERNNNQNGTRAKATIVKATRNNVDEIEFGSPFLATTAPKSLK